MSFLDVRICLAIEMFKFVGRGRFTSSWVGKSVTQVVLPGKTRVSVCQPKLLSKMREVALYSCARLYFATKDSFGFSGGQWSTFVFHKMEEEEGFPCTSYIP